VSKKSKRTVRERVLPAVEAVAAHQDRMMRQRAIAEALRGKPKALPLALEAEHTIRRESERNIAMIAIEAQVRADDLARLAGMMRLGVNARELVETWIEICADGVVCGRVNRLRDVLGIDDDNRPVREELKRLRKEFPALSIP
jgi:hypothetical protein